jgi:UDP-N-acetylmuramoyl-L-alanyl-D-glutamate--2,6-diaminopimelate ligase
MAGDVMTAQFKLPDDVRGISLDSRQVRPGWLYAALAGTATHGAKFIQQALDAGAVAILTDPAGKLIAGDVPVPVLLAENPRAMLAQLAADLYRRPARDLLMFAVTGTAGKTSTVAMLAAGLAGAGYPVGTIGTLGFFIGADALETDRSTVTTPESPDIQALLARMLAGGARAVAMEVTSHALAQHRADAIDFAVAGFTNLGHDHLDYHPSVEDYYQVKARLFTAEHAQAAVINIDDPFGLRLAEETAGRAELRLATVAMERPADYQIEVLKVDAAGRRALRLRTPSGSCEFTLGLLGEFNVNNALLAAAMLDQAGIDLSRALPALDKAYLPGRMQRVDLGEDAPYLVVDFAHTPETVRAALSALPKARRIAVLGCGGDRDREKRQPMGAAAARYADVVLVTDDNPRSEDPAAIRAEVLAGASQVAASSGAQVIDGGDRRAAIAQALALAGPGDWVAILGRGHETSQLIAGQAIPFSDVAVAQREWLDATAPAQTGEN